ncbi:glycoside hydrolase family 13 protein [Streptococcus infantis]|uniref:glycoside hydrolase family 13 protein n=1 Tax=Streptococcus infantis TaxID=68892 RepID=UPI0020C8A2AC|nr:glycoside hydrolase family 13 protein [Streptococcus infantis]MCP9056362.1 glycoside hydrolase family 13 protein [Streptococcus infantis]MCP9080452.1 glycoside hydrolase family 13 protein [Streptococcus infantis]
MELTAIYHRPESEYAYLYKENQLHIRIRTKKDDIQKVILHYGDPFIFIEDKYEAKKEMTKVTSDALFDYWQVTVSVHFARIQYLFELLDKEDKGVYYGDKGCVEYTQENLDADGNGFKLPYIHEIDGCQVPSWVSEAVWYQIFPERFANGNPRLTPDGAREWDAEISPGRDDFFGGDLQGIIDHLDYLKDLGITGLYLCPIFEATTNHKYDTTDYFEIDRHFGDKEVFRNLVDEAHKRGIKIMLDAVFNHIGYQSAQWQDVLKNGEKSAYKDWFHIQEFPITEDKLKKARELPYHTFAFASYMPKLNTANPEVKEFLLSVATYWIENFDIDAWRLDVANEIDHQFWRDFRKAVLAKKPDLYILGEIWHTSQPWLQGDEFHAVMNYPLSESIKDYFLRQHKKTGQFISEINSQSMYYKQQIAEVMFNLLDSHDTERILTTANGNIQHVKAALAFLYLQKGTPCIYYGTELALKGGPDPDCRRAMPWDRVSEDNDMLNFMKQLIQVRKEVASMIQHGSYSLQEVKPDVLALKWNYEGKEVQAIFNQSSENFVLDRDSVDLASHCQLEDGHQVILPAGFVIYISE